MDPEQDRGQKQGAACDGRVGLRLETPRLILREFELTDWRDVHVYAVDPEVVRYMEWGPNSEEQTMRFVLEAISLAKETPRRHYHLTIARKEDACLDGRLLGGCTLSLSSPLEDRGGMIGYCLSREAWGQGYATEAARALLDFGFGELRLHRIWATCDTRNLASGRVLEKIDMRREGCLRKHKLQRGEWRDSLLYAVLEDDWRSNK